MLALFLEVLLGSMVGEGSRSTKLSKFKAKMFSFENT